MIPYRVRQVVERRRARLSDEDLAWIGERLNRQEVCLFLTQERSDQGHALRVAQRLSAQGHDDPRLIAAALLHDVGKAPGVPLVYRTAYVLLKHIGLGNWLHRLAPGRGGWLAPLARAVHHPALGAAQARSAGSHEATVVLIAQHQERSPTLADELLTLLHALQAADDVL